MIETSWRKKPSYQGGFLLDGGVHFIAATRLLLSSAGSATAISAFTAQHQPHLPPVDTVDAVWKLSNGASGTFSNSFAMAPAVTEYRVVCEGGTVTAGFGTVPFSPAYVTVKRAGEDGEEKEEFPEVGFGVNTEVATWGEKLDKGGADERQSPLEALRDLEIVSCHRREKISAILEYVANSHDCSWRRC